MRIDLERRFLKSRDLVTIFITVFAFGYMVHGTMIFNSYMAFDDMTMNHPGASFTLGRWFLKVPYWISQILFGSYVNTKGFIGIVSLFLIAIIAVLIAKALQLKKTMELILLSCILVVFPYVTSLFGYTFTAIPYYLSDLMALYSAYLITRPGPKSLPNLLKRYVSSIILLTLSIAIYQTSVSLFIMLLVITEINNCLAHSVKLKKFIYQGISYIISLILSIYIYML